MMFCLLLAVTLALSFLAQEFLPVVTWAYEARVLLVTVVFFAGAAALPFPLMLVFAFATGFVWDARHLVIEAAPAGGWFPGEVIEAGLPSPSFGYSILLYGLLGSLMQGIRPLFRRGRWELPVLLCGIGGCDTMKARRDLLGQGHLGILGVAASGHLLLERLDV